MTNDAIITTVLEYLKQRHNLTDLEKSIIETANELSKYPFQRDSAERKVGENYLMHADLFENEFKYASALVQPLNLLPDEDVLGNLKFQLLKMCAKELSNSQ